MKEFKGTKGKWVVEPNSVFNEVISTNNSYKNNSKIMTIRTLIHTINEYGSVDSCNFSEEDNANARLIAAAPEMLDLLQNIKIINELHSFNGHLINEQIDNLLNKILE